MEDKEDSSDKSHEPTQKRLDDARAKGQIPRSQDLLSAMSLGGFVLAGLAVGPWVLQESGEVLRGILEQPESLRPLEGSAAALWPFLLVFLLPIVPVLALLFAQRALLFTTENLRPAFSRIDPLAGAKRRFGSEGLADFTKGLFKLILVSLALFYLFKDRAGIMLASLTLDPGPLLALLLRLLIELLILCLIIGMVLGAADFLWQIRQHRNRNRMSHKDLIDEHKESEGDPQARAARRQRGQEIAMNRMMMDVPKADVIIVNPTHFAVALKWQKGSGRAPICVAKGADEIAFRIRALAAQHGVPIHRDPVTARAVFATVEIGQAIRPDQYRAVAAAIRFAEGMRRKARGWK